MVFARLLLCNCCLACQQDCTVKSVTAFQMMTLTFAHVTCFWQASPCNLQDSLQEPVQIWAHAATRALGLSCSWHHLLVAPGLVQELLSRLQGIRQVPMPGRPCRKPLRVGQWDGQGLGDDAAVPDAMPACAHAAAVSAAHHRAINRSSV